MRHTVRSWILGAMISICCVAPFGGSAHAQYIFMDTNGDGACTSADVLTGSTTSVDVYLNTNHNQSGATVTCNSNPDQGLTIFAYDLLFQSSGSGTVTYNSWSNNMSGFSQVNALTTSGGAAGVGYSGPTPLGPGLFKLGTLNVTVTGSPVLRFRPNNGGVETINTCCTDFGTQCDATDNPNTYTLGIDFSDACGTAGGAPTNASPVLATPSDMTVTLGGTADQTLTATDANGDALTFSLLTGPAYAEVTTTNPGTGTATGNIHLAAPVTIQPGTANATIRVSDGTASDNKTILITVLPAATENSPPVLAQPSNMTVTAGATADQALTATDVNGDALTFSLTAGPTWAMVTTTSPGMGNAAGTLHLAPPSDFTGTATVAVTVSDGTATNTKTLLVTVTPAAANNHAPVLAQPADVTLNEGAVSNVTLAATDEDGNPITFSLASGPTFASVTTTSTMAGNLSLAPGFNDAGTYTVTVRASDGSSSDEKSLTVTVLDVTQPAGDTAPVLSLINDMTVAHGTTADQAISATDAESDAIAFSISGPDFVTLIAGAQTGTTANATIHVAPPHGVMGAFTATVTVTANGKTDSQTFTITVPCEPSTTQPTLVQPSDMTVCVGDTAEQQLSVLNAEGAVTFTLVSGPSFLTVSSTGLVHLAPMAGAETGSPYTVTVSAAGDTKTFTIFVHAAMVSNPEPPPGVQPPTVQPPSVQPPTETPTQTLAANAYVTGDNRVIRLYARGRSWSAEVEPVSAFQATDIVRSSLTASYRGVVIHAMGVEKVAPTDPNGTARLAGIFWKGDLLALFAALPQGRSTVDVEIAGSVGQRGTFKSTVSVDVDKTMPTVKAFGKAYPNPFNPNTTISFELAKAGRVRLRVFDVAGRLVSTLADREMSAGIQEVRWDATRRDGSRVSSGVYFYVLETPERTVRNDLIVAK